MELSSLHKRLLRVVLRGSVFESFGKVLLTPIKQIHKIPNGIAFDYKIPPSMCRIQKTHPVLSNAAALAIFDELSSDAMMVIDKRHRGGISVHLTTELIRPAKMNEDVVVITTADKIGKTLGFLSMELRDTKGDLIARGKHIKYMSMGWLHDTLVHPKLLRFTLALYEKFIATHFKTELDNIVYEPRHVEDSHEGIGSVFQGLSLQKADIFPAENSPERVYKIIVRPDMWNQLRLFHGGCAALAIEEACEAYLDEFRPKLQHSEQKKLYVEKMEVRYLAQLQGELEIRVRLEPATFHSNEVIMKGEVVVSDTQVIGIEFTCSCTRG